MDLLALSDTITILVELEYTLTSQPRPSPILPKSSDSSNRRKVFTFMPLTFAAKLDTDTVPLFLQSLSRACLQRIRSRNRTKSFKLLDQPLNSYRRSFYAVFSWNGLPRRDQNSNPLLGIKRLTTQELRTQLEMVRLRGYQDVVHVVMDIEMHEGHDSMEPEPAWRAPAPAPVPSARPSLLPYRSMNTNGATSMIEYCNTEPNAKMAAKLQRIAQDCLRVLSDDGAESALSCASNSSGEHKT